MCFAKLRKRINHTSAMNERLSYCLSVWMTNTNIIVEFKVKHMFLIVWSWDMCILSYRDSRKVILNTLLWSRLEIVLLWQLVSYVHVARIWVVLIGSKTEDMWRAGLMQLYKKGMEMEKTECGSFCLQL